MKNILSKIIYYLLILIAFLLPLHKNVVPALILSFVFFRLLQELIYEKTYFQHLRFNKLLFLPVLLFLFECLGLIYSNNLSGGYKEIERQLSLLAFPLFMPVFSKDTVQNYRKILYSFLIGNIVALLLCYANSFYNSVSIVDGHMVFKSLIYPYTQADKNFFYYQYFSFFIHPSYFAMYLTFCSVYIVFILNDKRKQFSKLKNVLLLILLFVFLFSIYLLSSKAGFITLFIVVFLLILWYGVKKKKIIITSIFLLVSIVGSILFVTLNPRLKSFSKDLQNAETKTELESTGIRVLLLKSGINVLKNNFWLGTSPGCSDEELIKEYRKYPNMQIAVDRNFGVHNQFLQTFIIYGVFGFILLIVLYLVPLIYSIKEKNSLLFIFLIISGVNFMFENMLGMLSGVVFFTLFYSLIIVSNRNKYNLI
jgi:Lipid A core - O-antigen ligase and related enzymes